MKNADSGSVIGNSLTNLKNHWKDDLQAGFSVSLIALPLSLGIAIASGFPPIAGMFAAIVGGLIVSRINGSHVTITGPAAGLIVVNLAAIETLGEGDNNAGYQYALGAIVVAGALIFLFGMLKTGKLGDFFPSSAVHGMLAAIGVIIMTKQLFVAVGVKAHGHELYEVMAEIPKAVRHFNPEVLIISLVSLGILLFHPLVKSKFIRVIPAPMWVILFAIPLEFLMDFEHEHEIIFAGEHHRVGPQLLVHLQGNILDSVVFPDFGKILTGGFWIAVISIALVTSIESLLSAIAVDHLDPQKRKTNLDNDLKGIGIGSGISALIGGLPMISEIVRSSANVNNKAKTQWSNFFHGAFLLLFIVAMGPIIEHIPLAALASMLIYTGFKLASPREFKHVYEIGNSELFVFVSTLIIVLATDLLIGIAAGIIINLIINIIKGTAFGNLFKLRMKVVEDNDTVILKPKDALVFSNYLALKKTILKNSGKKETVINMKDVTMIDHTVMHHLAGLMNELKEKGVSMSIVKDEHLTPEKEHPYSEKRFTGKKFEFILSKRDEYLIEYTDLRNLQYNPGSIPINYLVPFTSLTSTRIRKCNNIITLEIIGLPVTIADVELVSGAVKSIEVTVLHVGLDQKILPFFNLEKERMIDKIKDPVGWKDVDFESHRVFSDKYLLYGPDVNTIRQFFVEKLLNFLEKEQVYNVESTGDALVFYKERKVLNAKELDEIIEFSKGFLECIELSVVNH